MARHSLARRTLATPRTRTVTELLQAWSQGDDAAIEQLVPLVQTELRRTARAYMARERRGHTLQATALVNEAFLRLTDAQPIAWQDRAHFFGIAARLMRQVLVDHARARRSDKRGGDLHRVTLTDNVAEPRETPLDLLDLDRALDALAVKNARRAKVIELRYFGGLSVEETAEALHLSIDTIKRDWRLAKLWLVREMKGEPQ